MREPPPAAMVGDHRGPTLVVHTIPAPSFGSRIWEEGASVWAVGAATGLDVRAKAWWYAGKWRQQQASFHRIAGAGSDAFLQEFVEWN